MITYKSLKDHVYEYLYEKINTGGLKPKEKISENNLCKHLNVSRTPVREALIKLEEEGYVTRLPRRGFIVKEITLDKIKEIYSIIGCLEGMAASLAIQNRSDQDVSMMKQLVKKMDEAIGNRRLYEYFKLQRKFHNVYLEASGNSELVDLLTSLKKRFMKKAYFAREDDAELYRALKNFNKGHKKIIQLFVDGKRADIDRYLKEVHWNLDYASIVVSPFEASETKRVKRSKASS